MNFADELYQAMVACDFDARNLAEYLYLNARLLFIGNGGSAAIASHMANDFQKNGGMSSLAFNDGAALTCVGNDFGFAHVFEKQLIAHAQSGDCLIAISSSGQSPNILRAVQAVKAGSHIPVVTFTGFSDDNALCALGDKNYHVASKDYGIVESAHLAMLHATLRELASARH